MANQEDDLDLGDEEIDELEELEQSIKRGHRIMDMLMNHCSTKITDLQEAESFNSGVEVLAKEQEYVMRCLRHIREARDAEADLEGLSRAAEEITSPDNLAFFILPEVPEGDQREDGSTGKKISFARRWFAEKLSSEFGESSGEEGGTDVIGQLRQISTEFEANLYFLIAQLSSLTPESNKELDHYEKFKSSLERLAEDSGNEIVRGIIDFMTPFQWKVGDSGSSKGKVDKGRRIDSLLDQVFNNIRRVVFLVGQISSLADRIEECEAEQNDIDSKIQALKEMD